MATGSSESPGSGSPAGSSSGDGVGVAVVRLLAAIGRWSARTFRRLRQWNRRGGAGPSGLAALVETHALQSAGDATITVALAGSLFFNVGPDAARSRIALYLLVTMAPFAVVAPVLGPLLDRFRHGRRTALAATMIARAILALAIGHSLGHGDHTSVAQALTLYPAALGVLVCSKAYGIARSAAVPRLVPEGMTLVQANSRLTLAGVVAPAVAGGLAAAVVKTLGHRSELFLGAVVYVLAAVMATRLPRAADGGPDRPSERPTHGGLVRIGQMGADVRHALRSTSALKWLSGFLLFFGAFVVRKNPIGGLSSTLCLAELAVGIGAGNALGTVLGSRTSKAAGTRLQPVLLIAAALVCAYAASSFGVVSVFAVAVVASAAMAMSKLSLDSTIQRTVADDIQTSTFARSETTLQLAWVVGAGVGIVLPTRPGIGFSIATAVMGAALAVALGFRPRRSRKPKGDDLLPEAT